MHLHNVIVNCSYVNAQLCSSLKLPGFFLIVVLVLSHREWWETPFMLIQNIYNFSQQVLGKKLVCFLEALSQLINLLLFPLGIRCRWTWSLYSPGQGFCVCFEIAMECSQTPAKKVAPRTSKGKVSVHSTHKNSVIYMMDYLYLAFDIFHDTGKKWSYAFWLYF